MRSLTLHFQFYFSIYIGLIPSNRFNPDNILYSTHPTLKISDLAEYLVDLSISGAIYPGVPHFIDY